MHITGCVTGELLRRMYVEHPPFWEHIMSQNGELA
jgi:hypothetical protein